MHRIDNSLYLLYIEPKKEEKSNEPLNDCLSIVMDIALENSIKGDADYSKLNNNGNFHVGGGWMGSHTTDCGKRSDSYDFLLHTGHITNSLAPFYLRWYRNSIPNSELKKLGEVLESYRYDSMLPFSENVISEKIKELRNLE